MTWYEFYMNIIYNTQIGVREYQNLMLDLVARQCYQRQSSVLNVN